MNTTEWTPRIATADRYLDAQYLFMAAATKGVAIEETLNKLDEVRRQRVAMNALPPPSFQDRHQFSPEESADAVVFLEKTLKSRENEALLLGWIENADMPSDVRYLEKTCGLAADPDNDLFFVGGSRVSELKKHLVTRRYRRVIDINEISIKEGSNEIDEMQLQDKLEDLPNIRTVRPERAHYLNPDAGPTLVAGHSAQIQRRVKLLHVGRNTNVLMAPLWTTQLLKNIFKLAWEGRNALGLKDSLLGCSAVVIGAGPSLDELLPKIAANQKKLIVICAFKALKAVAAAGIAPDFVVCLDPKQKIRHLEGVDLKQIGGFLIEVASHDELVAAIDGCALLPYVASDLPIELLRTLDLVDVPVIGTSGSAVHSAIQLAVLTGCSRIYLAGTDFGFPQNRLYGSGAGTGDEFVVSDDGRSYTRTPVDSHFREGELQLVPSNDGRGVRASLEMIKFREWVEARITNLSTEKSIEFKNLCRQGAIISGAPFESIDSLPSAAEKPNVRTLVNALPSVSKTSSTKLYSVFAKRKKSVDAILDACKKLHSKKSKGEALQGMLANIQRLSKRCPEVSFLINDKLIELNEYKDRKRVLSDSERESILRKLVHETHQAARELSAIYGTALSAVPTLQRRHLSGLGK